MDLPRSSLPKIAPHVHRRAKVQGWLEFHAGVALRFLAAPAGSGKTTAAVLYARSRPHPVAYIALTAAITPALLYRRIAENAGLEPQEDYAAFVRGLERRERVEIIIDDVDRATPAVRAALAALYRDVAETVTLIYLARSADALAFDGADARGLVAVCDESAFAFRIEEIALFAQALGLREDQMSIMRLHRATLGWATAVAGVCLQAAATGSSIRDAWPRWRRISEGTLAELVADALHCAPPDVSSDFTRVISGQLPVDDRMLRGFARYGLFSAEHDGRRVINPVIAHAPAGDVPDAPAPGSAVVEMFGRFSCTIDGRPVMWQRRRDRQLIQYLALQPDGRASRAQLIATFWPDADQQLAAQSLRTACSTIRRAFAACVGAAHVSRYFVADHMVALKLDAVVSSAARFQTHVDHADRAFEGGDARAAYAHYCAAERLYIAPLLAAEPSAAWSDAEIQRLAGLQRRCKERLMLLSSRITSDDVAYFPSIVAGHGRSA